MVRRFRCRLQRKAGCRACSKFISASARCLWGGGAVLELAARVAPRQLRSAKALRRSAASAEGFSPSARGHGAMYQPPHPTPSRLPREKQAHSRRLQLSLGRWCSAQPICARARAALVRSSAYGRRYIDGRLLILARRCGATFQLLPPTRSRLLRMQQAHRPSWLSLERRRSTRACCALAARVPRRASYGLPRHYDRALRPQKSSLLRHAAMVRRVSCRFLRQAGCRMRSKRTRAGPSCLWGGGAARKRSMRTRGPRWSA